MFVACILIGSKEKVVIPVSWFASLDIVQIFNIGRVRGKVHKIFYFKDKSVDPNFRLPLQTVFNADVRACYEANVLHAFRKLKKTIVFLCFIYFFVLLDTEEQATEYINSRRRILPVIYNHNLQKYNWNAPEPDDATCNATVHVKLEFEVERLTNEVHRLQNQMSVDNLDHDELEEIQRIILESDDEDVVELLMPIPKIKTEQVEEEDFDLHFDGTSIDSNENSNGQQATNVNSISTQSSQSIQLNENTVVDDGHTPNQSTTANANGNYVSSDAGPSSQSVDHTHIHDPVVGHIEVVTDVITMHFLFN